MSRKGEIVGIKHGEECAVTHTDAKSRVHVKIYGEEYTMRGPSSPDYMKRVAYYVDEKMKLIGQANNRLGINKIAVLTAINLTDELFRVRQELQALENRFAKNKAQ
jgi:cell division protein ZapA